MTNFLNVAHGKGEQNVTGTAVVGTDTIRLWIDIANMFNKLRPGPLALKKPDALTMQQFVLEMRKLALSGRSPRLIVWLNDPRRYGALYEGAHIAHNLLARAAQWKPELKYDLPLSTAALAPAWLIFGVDKDGRYSAKEDDLFRDEFLPALCSLPPFWKETRNAGRIRRCPICQKLYYATRKDRSACSNQCALTWRVRLSRGRTEEEHEQLRNKRKHARYLKEEGRAPKTGEVREERKLVRTKRRQKPNRGTHGTRPRISSV